MSRRFEYKRFVFGIYEDENLLNFLNSIGREGWEAIKVEWNGSLLRGSYLILAKREVLK